MIYSAQHVHMDREKKSSFFLFFLLNFTGVYLLSYAHAGRVVIPYKWEWVQDSKQSTKQASIRHLQLPLSDIAILRNPLG